MTSLSDEKWRDAAINAALRTLIAGGSTEDTLLRLVRIRIPNINTLIQPFDGEMALRFLREQTTEFRSLLDGQSEYSSNEIRSYLSWHAFQWQGSDIEVVSVPACSRTSAVLGFGNNMKALHSLFEALHEYSIRPQGRCLRYAQGWERAPDLDEEIGKVTWDDVVLTPEITRPLRESVEGFFAQKKVFHDLGFAWRRGILLVGPPGTGKTMVCKAVAASLPTLPFLYVRDLHGNGKEEAIKKIFERARKLSPCILVFEDIDGFINEHNRTVFLNEMDGFQSNDGLLVIASSNHPGKIDEALLKRPSRFDRVFHIGLPKKPERIEYCRRILSRTQMSERIDPVLDKENLASQVGEKTDGFTPAYLKEVFTAAALSRAQEGATTLDEKFADAVMSQVEELRAHLKRAKDPDSLATMSGSDDVVGFRR